MNDATKQAEMKRIIGREVSDNVQRTDSRFGVELNRLIDELSEPGMFETVAIHEAGHEHYYLLAGGSDIEFIPPVVRFYRDRPRPFNRQMAALKVHKCSPTLDPDWFSQLAKGYVAGGECSVRFPALRRRRDGADLKAWNETCMEGYKGLFPAEIDNIAKKKWAEAQEEVRGELDDRALEEKIRRRAAEITPLLFSWLHP
jgi:hypothetical protein